MWKVFVVCILGSFFLGWILVGADDKNIPKSSSLLPINIPETITIHKDLWEINTHGASFINNGETDCVNRIIYLFPENIKISDRYKATEEFNSRLRKTLFHELLHAMSCGWSNDGEIFDITKYNSIDGRADDHEGADRLAFDLDDLFSHNRDLESAMFGK